MTNEYAQKAAEKISTALDGVVEGWTEDFAIIILTHAIEPAIKERDEVIEELKACLEVLCDSVKAAGWHQSTYKQGKEAILAAEQLLAKK